MKTALPPLLRFGLVGLVGMCVDLTTTAAVLLALDTVPEVAKFVGFCLAVAVTFVLNRRFTFATSPNVQNRSAIALYCFGQAVGAVINIVVFSAILSFFHVPLTLVEICLSATAAAGIAWCFNYVYAARVVFPQ